MTPDASLVLTPRALPSEKLSGERSRISCLGFFPKMVEPHVFLRPAQQVSGESMNSKLSEVRLRWFVRIPSKCTGTFIVMSYQIEATFLVNINKYLWR